MDTVASEHLRKAADCHKRADQAPDAASRKHWLTMAALWEALAETAARNHSLVKSVDDKAAAGPS